MFPFYTCTGKILFFLWFVNIFVNLSCKNNTLNAIFQSRALRYKDKQMMERPQPSCTEVIGKASLEILGFVLLILPMAYIYVFTKQYKPYHRCSKLDISFPLSNIFHEGDSSATMKT